MFTRCCVQFSLLLPLWKDSHHAFQFDLELAIILLHTSMWWDYSCVPPYLSAQLLWLSALVVTISLKPHNWSKSHLWFTLYTCKKNKVWGRNSSRITNVPLSESMAFSTYALSMAPWSPAFVRLGTREFLGISGWGLKWEGWFQGLQLSCNAGAEGEASSNRALAEKGI